MKDESISALLIVYSTMAFFGCCSFLFSDPHLLDFTLVGVVYQHDAFVLIFADALSHSVFCTKEKGKKEKKKDFNHQ